MMRDDDRGVVEDRRERRQREVILRFEDALGGDAETEEDRREEQNAHRADRRSGCTSAGKSGATTYRMIGSANTNASSEATTVTTAARLMTAEASRQARSRSPAARKPPKIGMKADPNAPDMTTRKSRSGMRNAAT